MASPTDHGRDKPDMIYEEANRKIGHAMWRAKMAEERERWKREYGWKRICYSAFGVFVLVAVFAFTLEIMRGRGIYVSVIAATAAFAGTLAMLNRAYPDGDDGE